MSLAARIKCGKKSAPVSHTVKQVPRAAPLCTPWKPLGRGNPDTSNLLRLTHDGHDGASQTAFGKGSMVSCWVRLVRPATCLRHSPLAPCPEFHGRGWLQWAARPLKPSRTGSAAGRARKCRSPYRPGCPRMNGMNRLRHRSSVSNGLDRVGEGLELRDGTFQPTATLFCSGRWGAARPRASM